MKVVITLCFISIMFSYIAAYDPLDPTGNITIKWDIMSWTLDGYLAVLSINNLQMYRQIGPPGWTLGWTWAKKEVIWAMVGAQTNEQGDCSKFKLNIPHCCNRSPIAIDLLPSAPYNQRFTNCCKAGLLGSFGQDPSASSAQFQVTVGDAGTSVDTVDLPTDFTLLGPGPGYTCGPAKIVPATIFFAQDPRRKTQAMMTWNVTCTYSPFLARKHPPCCVSLSTFYNEAITSCPSCACGCERKSDCIKLDHDSKIKNTVELHGSRKDNSSLLGCTQHMCPIRVHWHVKTNYMDYWRVKVSITNFNYGMNFSDWTLVVQHPNMNNVTQVFSFNYKPIAPYDSINDTGMFYGMKNYNEMLLGAVEFGSVQSEILMQKDRNTFSFGQGWAFPRKVYFNGDECVLPSPDLYPYLPNFGARTSYSMLSRFICSLLTIVLLTSKMHLFAN